MNKVISMKALGDRLDARIDFEQVHRAASLKGVYVRLDAQHNQLQTARADVHCNNLQIAEAMARVARLEGDKICIRAHLEVNEHASRLRDTVVCGELKKLREDLERPRRQLKKAAHLALSLFVLGMCVTGVVETTTAIVHALGLQL